MALAKSLDKVQRAAKSKRRLHVEYLQALLEHGPKASLADAAGFLARLRRTRDDVLQQKGPSGQQLARWSKDCEQHEGYAALRKHIFEGQEKLEESSNSVLSRLYNGLLRVNFRTDADQVWPVISKRVASGNMMANELLGIWSVTPKQNLPLLDNRLAKAMREDESLKTWQFLNAMSRAREMPESKVSQACASALSKRLKDLSSGDLAVLVGQLGKLLAEAEFKGAMALNSLLRSARSELVERGGELETSQLCGVLGAIETCEEPLWALVRQQLLTRDDLEVQHVLEVLGFLNRASAKQAEQPLKNVLLKRLQKLLNQGNPEPELVAAIARRLDVIVSSFYACQSLLNTAVKLREDLYPIVLWRLFVRAGEAELLQRHPKLQPRMDRIGSILESHGIKKERLSLKEMVSVARAMRKNNVKLERCSKQMAAHFVEVLQRGEEEASRRATGKAQVTVEADADAAKADAPSGESSASGADAAASAGKAEGTAALTSGADAAASAGKVNESAALTSGESSASGADEAASASKADESEALTSGPSSAEGIVSLMAEVQKMLLIFWAQLDAMELDDEALTAAATRICAGPCHIEAQGLAECDFELSACQGSQAAALREGLARSFQESLAGLAEREVLQLATNLVSTDMQSALAAEIDRRTKEGGLDNPKTALDLDLLVKFLAQLAQWRSRTDPHVHEALVAQISELVSDALPSMLAQEPEDASRRLFAAVSAFSSLGLSDGSWGPSLRQGLQQLTADQAEGLHLAESTDLAFAFASLHGGLLPFDMLARLWRLTSRGVVAHTQDAQSLTSAQTAKLWAFILAAQHLSSSTVLASLKLAPEAPALEAFVNKKEKQSARLQLGGGDEPKIQELILQFRTALPAALPGELSEERFQVPETPYVADFAFEGLRRLLVVVRPEHTGGFQQLSGQGMLMARTLEALGWSTCWVWPQEWSTKLTSLPEQEATEALQKLLGTREP